MKQIIYLAILWILSFTSTAQTSIDGMIFSPDIDENGNRTGTCTLIKYEGRATEIKIPMNVEIDNTSYEVTVIGIEAFSNNQTIEKVIFPETLKTIDNYAFSECVSLREIVLNEGLEEINDHAFRNDGLIEIVFPNSLSTIGNCAFMYCKLLREVVFPDSLRIICNSAFSSCESLCKVVLNEGLEVIENRAFYNDEKIKDLHFPNSLKRIGDNAFQYCSFDVILPQGLEYIGSYAFQGRIYEEIKIPSSVIEIGLNAFDARVVVFEEGDNILNLGEDCITNSSYLESLVIKRNVELKKDTHGHGDHFYNLRNVFIGKKVDNMSWMNPSTIPSITQIVCESSNPTIFGGPFTNDQYSNLKVFVLKDYIELFENDTQWCFFKNLICSDIPFDEYELELQDSNCTVNVGDYYDIRVNPIPQNNVSINSNIMALCDDWNLSLGITKDTIRICGAKAGQYDIAVILTINNKKSNYHVTVIQPATSIILNKSELTLEKGETATLLANVAPIDVSDSSITWISTNSEVATVEEGIVKAIGSGVCQIIASTHNGLTAECTVMVNPILVESIEITPNVLEAEQGESIQLIAIVLPEYATNKEVEWSSDDDSIAEVSVDGLVKIISPGVTTIRAKSTDNSNIEGICEITGVADVGTLLAKWNHFNLYTADGVLVFKNASREQILQLAPGIYIVTDGTQKFKFIKN